MEAAPPARAAAPGALAPAAQVRGEVAATALAGMAAPRGSGGNGGGAGGAVGTGGSIGSGGSGGGHAGTGGHSGGSAGTGGGAGGQAGSSAGGGKGGAGGGATDGGISCVVGDVSVPRGDDHRRWMQLLLLLAGRHSSLHRNRAGMSDLDGRTGRGGSGDGGARVGEVPLALVAIRAPPGTSARRKHMPLLPNRRVLRKRVLRDRRVVRHKRRSADLPLRHERRLQWQHGLLGARATADGCGVTSARRRGADSLVAQCRRDSAPRAQGGYEVVRSRRRRIHAVGSLGNGVGSTVNSAGGCARSLGNDAWMTACSEHATISR